MIEAWPPGEGRKVDVTLRIDEASRQKLDEIVSRLEEAGLSNVSTSRRFGLVHGEVEVGEIDVLNTVAGVESVRRSRDLKAI